VAVSESRRHRLIWVAVAGVHLVALGAVWAGGGLPSAEPTREGGLLLVSLAPDPVAVPGETKEGMALGAGAPLVVVVFRKGGMVGSVCGCALGVSPMKPACPVFRMMTGPPPPLRAVVPA
jgi:hypothetical protein